MREPVQCSVAVMRYHVFAQHETPFVLVILLLQPTATLMQTCVALLSCPINIWYSVYSVLLLHCHLCNCCACTHCCYKLEATSSEAGTHWLKLKMVTENSYRNLRYKSPAEPTTSLSAHCSCCMLATVYCFTDRQPLCSTHSLPHLC
jgi:hypothetical protein